MNESLKPSKHFLIRGGIAVALLIIILTVQAGWFKKLFNKKNKGVTPVTVGDIIGADTNNNGLSDWEEKLWGLDPTVLYTNGVPNSQIIADKKKVMGITEPTSDQPLDDTDRLARELFTLTSALGQSDEVDDQTLAAIAAKLGSSVEIKQVNNQYSLKDIQTVQTNVSTLTTYHNSLAKVYSHYDVNTPDIEVLATAIQNEDPTSLSQLSNSAKTYQNLAKEMKGMKVPIGLVQDHVSMMNSYSGIATSFSYLTQLNDNSIAALVGVAIYRNYITKLNNSVNSMSAYLNQYGIL